ncbi:Predicted arabinose efflux permease, MFS family [Halomicrobium zhouii]|uniref:Predicted arabinose efflux permease, MFS family n=1 Tax=Halomicrobium zhouii TaxID=767519 RepID=A0A1I6K3S7_9EURY|nr:MFS transporter [Halomicrobium zhouii]SFR85901.1 Predicted arabinose efflux permease, MFS family [Halomicrobium zhouii]
MTESATAKPPGRLGVFVSICTFSFLVNFGRIAFAPLVDFFISNGISPAAAGLAATAVWVGSALPRLPTGYLLTFVSRHRTLLGMGLGLSAAAAFTALAPGIWLTVVGALFVGLATGVFFIAANPLVSELYPEKVGIAVGLRGMSSQIAAVSAPFLVAVAIGMGSWRIAFGALAVLALAGTAAFALAVRRAELPTAGVDDRDLIAGIRAQWPLVAAGVVFVGFTGFVWQGVFNFYVTYLGAAKDIPPGTANNLLTLTFAAGVPSFIVAGRLADRFSYLSMLLSVLGGFVVTLVAFTMVEGVLAIAAVSVVMGLVVHGLFPVGDAYLLDNLPDENRASAYSGFSATMMLIQAPGSVAVGLLAQAGLSYSGVFYGYAGLVAVIAIGMAVLARAGKLPTGS